MTGAGAPGGPGIIKCLKAIEGVNLYVGDANNKASGKFLHDNFIELPFADEFTFEEKMITLCKQHSIKIIFPLVTKELFKFSKSKSLFESNGIKVIVSDFKWLSIANNKSLLYQHLADSKIEMPKFRVVSNYDEFLEAKTYLMNLTGGYCIKPSVSNGSRGVRIVSKDVNEYSLLFEEKPNSLYINDKTLCSILENNPFPELLVSEILPGIEYTIDTVVDRNHNPLIILPRKRITTNGGISTSGQFENNEEIISSCKEIIGSMKLTGPIGIQMKEDSKGLYKVLEINPRIQGTSVASLGLGINLPKIAIDAEFNRNFEEIKINWGLSFVRYYEEVFF